MPAKLGRAKKAQWRASRVDASRLPATTRCRTTTSSSTTSPSSGQSTSGGWTTELCRRRGCAVSRGGGQLGPAKGVPAPPGGNAGTARLRRTRTRRWRCRPVGRHRGCQTTAAVGGERDPQRGRTGRRQWISRAAVEDMRGKVGSVSPAALMRDGLAIRRFAMWEGRTGTKLERRENTNLPLIGGWSDLIYTSYYCTIVLCAVKD